MFGVAMRMTGDLTFLFVRLGTYSDVPYSNSIIHEMCEMKRNKIE